MLTRCFVVVIFCWGWRVVTPGEPGFQIIFYVAVSSSSAPGLGRSRRPAAPSSLVVLTPLCIRPQAGPEPDDPAHRVGYDHPAGGVVVEELGLPIVAPAGPAIVEPTVRVVVVLWVVGVGCWVLVVGCWLLVVGCWLLEVGIEWLQVR